MEPHRHLPPHGDQDSAAGAEPITPGPGANPGPFDAAPPLPPLPGRLPDAQEPNQEGVGRNSEVAPTIRPRVVAELVAYLRREADLETADRIEAGFVDRGSEVSRLLDAIWRKAEGEAPLPGDTDFGFGYQSSYWQRRNAIPREKSWSDRFREANESLTEEEEARLEAEFQALRESRKDIPDDGRWIDDGPDPFGMDWAWCDGPFDDE